MSSIYKWFSADFGGNDAGVLAHLRKYAGPALTVALSSHPTIVEDTGQPAESYVSPAMQHGIDTEPMARAFYSFMNDIEIVETGLVRHPTISWTHASPDGLIGDHGMVELKCPQPAAHLDLLLGETVPGKYLLQAAWQMACTGRAWVDFVSYSPVFPETMRMFTRRIERDDRRIAELEREVCEFLNEVDQKIAALLDRFGAKELELCSTSC